MSYPYDFSFGPATPPDYSYELAFQQASFGNCHIRGSSQDSHASLYSQRSTPESVSTQLTTPVKSPIRQHGPLLLPKIRHQDQAIEQPPKRVRKTVSPKMKPTNAVSWRPSHNRSFTNPEMASFQLQTLATPNHSRSSSTLCSPVSMTNDIPPRRSSSCSLDGQTLGKFGFPTYRQMPTYISSDSQIESFVPKTYFAPTPREPSPIRNEILFEEFTNDLVPMVEGNTTTLMSYLSSHNPAPSLVRQLNIHVRDGNTKHFWWDVRQIRPWTSFNASTLTSMPGLHALLTIPISTTALPPPPAPRTLHPDTESELYSIYTNFYATKLNAALLTAQGSRHLMMRSTTGPSSPSSGSAPPSFISNYTDDTSELIYGRGLGRVVGLVKSFDRWNTGMRVEGNHKKVEYLRGLAHLHRHMRENNCRYGFIMTEIELVVVRNGAEATPHFGYLELQTIQLAAHDDDTEEVDEDGNVLEKEPQMTALLALFYLHMLARDAPLPGQTTWKSEIGAPAEGTRRKCLPKDEWIPEPQLAEKREAKRARGWVWPEESVGRKELGKRGVRYGNC